MGKRLKKIFDENSFDSLYAIDEGAGLAINTSTAKFQETIDICINLNIDPKKPDPINEVYTDSQTGETITEDLPLINRYSFFKDKIIKLLIIIV